MAPRLSAMQSIHDLERVVQWKRASFTAEAEASRLVPQSQVRPPGARRNGRALRLLWSRARSQAGSYARDLNANAAWAGLTTFIWYAVGLVPVQIAVTGRIGLSPAEVSSWIFIIWFTGAIASLALSLTYRQPIPITSTIPGLLFLGALAGHYSFAELVGANLLAGVLIVALGVLGVGARILRWLPVPLAVGMLAGSVFGDLSRMVSATVAGYALGRLARRQRLPPVGVALLAGGLAVLITRRPAPSR